MRHTVKLTAIAQPWRIERKGSFILRDSDGAPSAPLGRKAKAILAYLSTHADEHVARDRIVELLWADRGDAQARGSLRQALFEIRRAAPDLIGSDHQHVWVEGSRVSCTEELATAELFADLNGITPEFDEWLRSERAIESHEQWSELEHQVESLLHRKKGSTALPLLERMEPLDPYNEDWLRLAMRAEALAGHPAGIQKRYSEFAECLRRDLSVAPAIETRELRDKLIRELTAETRSEGEPEPPALQPAQLEPATRPVQRRNPWLIATGSAAILASLGLTQSATTAAVAIPTVAVLPFEAVGIQPALADGFSDELLTYLVRNRGLRVIGRTAFSDVHATPEGLKSFRKELGVEYIIEGRVAPSEGKLRVLVSLVRTKDAKTVWAENFIGNSEKLQSIQAAIGSAVGQSLSGNAPRFAQKTTSGEAYALYLRAKGLIRDRDQESYSTATELLGAALRADPKFAAAWAQLAAIPRLAETNEAIADPINPGKTLTAAQGAQRALDLDPNLAEAHATMALVKGWATASGRAHLNKALALEPRDPQILYWAGNAAASFGNCRLMREFYRRSASFDPTFKRPVITSIEAAIQNGDRSSADRYLTTIKKRNPAGAVEVEIAYRYMLGDFSAAAAIAIKDWVSHNSWDAGKFMAKEALLGIGASETPFGPFTPVGRAISFGRLPDRSWLLSQAKEWQASASDEVFYFVFLWSLAREKRWTDIVALYDQQIGVMSDLTSGDPGGRYARLSFGGITALALKKAGRDQDAVKVALATQEAINFALANGDIPAETLASIAQDEAVLGQREAALTHLEQAYSMGWRMFLYTNRYMNPAEDPTFATLRGDRRFQRINRLIVADKARERREYLSFMNQPSWRDAS